MTGFSQSGKSIFDTLYVLEDVRITLTYPFDSLYKTNQDEIEATITIESKSGILFENEELKLNLRGKFRRMKCEMPPLMLNFKKSMLRDAGLNKIDDIKLVTHCLTTPEGQTNLQKEYLCYKLYENISPYAYRTLWLTVTYIDALSIEESVTSAGFLIEPDKSMMARYGVIEKKLFNVAEDSINFESYSAMAAFNCMIGNRDWSIIMSRNAKLFFDPVIGQYIVIPYDFDYSNVVGASYRRESRPETMVHPYDRIYQGEYFVNRSGEILTSFLRQKEKVLENIDQSNGLMDNATRKKIAKYCETWFQFVSKVPAAELTYGMVIPYKGGL